MTKLHMAPKVMVRMSCAVCGADDDERRYYWLKDDSGPVACRDHAPNGSLRNDHPYEVAYRKTYVDELLRKVGADLQQAMNRLTHE